MRKVKVEELSKEAFAPFGEYVDMASPKGEFLGAKPVVFFRDMMPVTLGCPSSEIAFSICQVEKRPMVVDIAEYHSACGEVNLPIDADILVHVAPATPNGVCPFEKFRVFRIPKNTLFYFRPGVWHHAPYVCGNASVANVMVVLPERTYANDCIVVEFNDSQKFEFAL